MKKNNKGFILAETIVVSSVVIGALVIIYINFISIINSYNNSFSYNTVQGLYSLNNFKEYLLNEDYNLIETSLNNNNYVDLTTCPTDYFTEYLYCQSLINKLNIKVILFTKEDTSNLVDSLKTNNPFDEKMKKFINLISSDKEANKYRLIVEYKDGTFASLKFY